MRLSNGYDRQDHGTLISRLPVLVLNVHSRCNCRCVMCDIWKRTEQTTLTPDDLEAMMESISTLRVEWIVFTGGEPLMNPHLPLLAKMLREQGVKLTLLSTGILLARLAAEVAASFDDVIVSLDGPPAVHDQIRRVKGAFDALANGVSALHRIAPQIPVHTRTTVQKANHSCLRDIVGAARAIGAQSVSFLPADVTSSAFNRELVWPKEAQNEISLTAQETLQLEAEVERMIEDNAVDIGSGFIAEGPDKLRRIVLHFRALLGQAEPSAPVCNAPWVSAVIESDGTVKPCFFHRSIGNIHEASLDAILNSKAARDFRANLDIANNDICKSCVCSLNYRAA